MKDRLPPYEPPPFRINLHRDVAREKQHNNIRNLMEARRDLDEYATHLAETGTPRSFHAGDLDTGGIIPMEMGWDNIDLMDRVLNHVEQGFAKEGIIFEPEYGRGGERYE